MGDRLTRGDRRRTQKLVAADRRQRDRRRAVRAPIDLWMEESKGNELYFRRTGNLSAGGVYFEQSIPHALGTRVNLKFTLPGQDQVIETLAEIVNTPGDKEGLGMGVRFIDLDEIDRRRIESYVRTAIESRPQR
ncbi:MAG: PilZ domain-containing protein [Deltaproteobacteria bacterium]|nr:PilZ domain-containing protein [Deltaproteobacteria bacterium]